MIGSILINCWFALFGFAISFIFAIQNSQAMPIPTILMSLAIAFVAFILAFPVRMFLNYIFYTPEDVKFIDGVEKSDGQNTNIAQPFTQQNNASTVEFSDESTEDIAQVVRTMMHTEEASSS